MQTRMILYADEGKVLTDGKIYGTQIFVALGKSIEDFYEITTEEYENIIKAQDQENEVI